MNRKPFTIVGAAAAITGAGLLSLAGFSHVSAWGNGQICYYGQTYTFQTEQAYYAFLREHPHATEGTCTTTTTTTIPETTTTQPEVTTTTQPEQTTTTVAETTTTVAETTTTVPETTIPETTVPETTVPVTTVPETTVPATSTTAVSETSQPSDTTSPAIMPPATTQPPSAGRGELPHTGPNDNTAGFAAAGFAALLGGSALVFVARRRKDAAQ